MTMKRKFTTQKHDSIEVHDTDDEHVALNVNNFGSPVVELNIDELEVLRDIFDAFVKAKRTAKQPKPQVEPYVECIHPECDHMGNWQCARCPKRAP